MGLLGKKKEAELAVGEGLVAVLPTNPKPWYLTPHLLKLNLCLLAPLFSAASVGYDGSMMNGLQTLSQWRDYFDNPQGAMLGLVNSVYPLGKVVGLFVVTYICDKYGRRLPLYIGFAGGIGFALLQGFAQNFTMFVTARAFLGFFTSFMSQASPILITELAYPTQRGKLTSLYQTSYYFGAIFAAWLTYGTFRIDSTWSWRIPSILQGAVPLVQACGLLLVPESPRWLVSRGRSEEARKILAKCHAGGDMDSPLVDFEINEIEATLDIRNATETSLCPQNEVSPLVVLASKTPVFDLSLASFERGL
ncbi:MFS general substrate transporter [Coniochaeta sp. PMI_546]|nr:MFS general substrate transporter [Coniochaeta sp. PMI_546]